MQLLQVATLEAVSAETAAKLERQGRAHGQEVKLLQQQRKGEEKGYKEKLQQQMDEVKRWRGEVRRLNNVVLTNNAKSGKFYEVGRTPDLNILFRHSRTHHLARCKCTICCSGQHSTCAIEHNG